MNAENRNSIVVISLIASMTAGAWLLMTLAPAPVKFGPDRLLAASGGTPVAQVRIDYIAPDEPADSAAYHCIITPDGGHSLTELTEATLRIAVVGSDGPRLPDPQKKKLMQVLGSLHQSHGVAVSAMLHGTGLTQTESDTPLSQAADLQLWLASKGVVRQ